MLTAHCPARDHFVDLNRSDIEGFELRGDRLVVRWRCRCGHHGTSITRRVPAPTVA